MLKQLGLRILLGLFIWSALLLIAVAVGVL
jgi:hypothetical protein